MNYETAKLGYYNTTDGSPRYIWISSYALSIFPSGGGIISQTPIPLTQTNSANSINSSGLLIVIGVGCNSNNTFIGNNPNPNTAAVLYVTETASGNGSMQCLEQ